MTEIEKYKNYIESPFLSFDNYEKGENSPVEAIAKDISEQTKILLCKFHMTYPGVNEYKIVDRVCEILGELIYD